MNGAFYDLTTDVETVFCTIFNAQFTDIMQCFHNISVCFESANE